MGTFSARSRLRFGSFEFEPNTGELYRDGRLVHLQEHPRQVLLALLERPGDVVTRELATLTGLVRAVGYQTLRRSYLFNLLRTARAREWAGVPRELRLADRGRLELLADDFEAKRARAQPGQPEFQLVVAALARIAALAAQHGTRVVVVLQPGKEEVYLPLLGERPSDTTNALRPELERRGIEYLDLVPAFRAEAAAGARLFYEFDGHPNARGYALTAELVKAYVTEHAGRLGLAVASGAGR